MSVAEVRSAIFKGEPHSATLGLSEFRDLYQQLSTDSGGRDQWVIVLLEEQAIAQSDANPDVRVFITGENVFTRSSFAFMAEGSAAFVGAVDGKYRFRDFYRDVVGWRHSILWCLAAVGVVLFLYFFVPFSIQESLAGATVNALAIFVTIFALFVLAVDPKREYPYLRSGRYHKLARTDSYIAIVALTALLLSVAAFALTAHEAAQPGSVALAASGVLGVALIVTALSFWLLLGYHFERRREMASYLMAQEYLETVKAQSIARRTKGAEVRDCGDEVSGSPVEIASEEDEAVPRNSL